jgi:hypothetical protein
LRYGEIRSVSTPRRWARGLSCRSPGSRWWFTARHATDHERIERARYRLAEDVGEAGRLRCYDLEAAARAGCAAALGA